jgi:hypothetical protein
MGFMDKMKGAMDQASEASKKMGSTMSAGMSASTADYAQLANKLAQSGVPCTAEIRSMNATGKTDYSGQEYSFAVRVEGNGDPYDATIVQFLPEGGESNYNVGDRFQAKADPDAPTRLLLYGKA